MYYALCSKLALDTAGTFGQSPAYSQPVAMNGGNAVQWEAVVFYIDRDGIVFQLQTSNDLENWTDKGSVQTMNSTGHKLFTAETDVATAYVRLKYSVAESGKAILAAGINISSQ